MDPSGVLAELLSALPELASRLQVVASSLPDYGSGTLTAVNPGGTEPPRLPPPPPGPIMKGRLGAGRHAPPPSLPEDEVAPPVAAAGMDSSGTKKTNAKPGSAKAKFSSITGPDIYYDGKSQKCLFDCWTALNAKRGVLRKEMMLIRRKKVMTLPPATYGYSDSDDELEADDGASSLSSKPRDSATAAAAESAESRRRRLYEERLRAEEARKKEEDERRNQVFEHIDSCLDKAARACENAATVWLKGEGCIGHVVFITARIMDAVHKIDAELGRHVPADDGYDEGFEEELDDGAGQADHPPEEELPHKKAGPPPGRARDNTHFRRRSTSRQPVEVSG